MRRLLLQALALSLAILPFCSIPARAQTARVAAACGSTSPFPALNPGAQATLFVDPNGNICGGGGGGGGGGSGGAFLPTPAYASLVAADAVNHSVSVPTGTDDVISNLDTSIAYCNFGATAGTAGLTFPIPAGASYGFHNGNPNAYATIQCQSPNSTLNVTISGGAGLFAGAGGGGSGSTGGPVTAISGAFVTGSLRDIGPFTVPFDSLPTPTCTATCTFTTNNALVSIYEALLTPGKISGFTGVQLDKVVGAAAATNSLQVEGATNGTHLPVNNFGATGVAFDKAVGASAATNSIQIEGAASGTHVPANVSGASGVAVDKVVGGSAATNSIQIEGAASGTHIPANVSGATGVAVDKVVGGSAATNSIQVEGAASGTSVPVQLKVGTTGGATTYHHLSVATAGGDTQNVKNAAGTLYSITAVQTTSTAMEIKFYNLSAAPTCSSATGVSGNYPIQSSSISPGMHLSWPNGLAFGTGISYCIVLMGVPPADTDAGTPVVGLVLNLSYN